MKTKTKKLLHEQECVGKTIKKVLLNTGRLILLFEDDEAIAFNGYTAREYQYDLDVINVCENNEFSKYDLLDLGLITEEKVAEIEAQEEEEWRKNNKEANIIKFKHLSSYLKKLCLTESELVKIVIEAYTK